MCHDDGNVGGVDGYLQDFDRGVDILIAFKAFGIEDVQCIQHGRICARSETKLWRHGCWTGVRERDDLQAVSLDGDL